MTEHPQHDLPGLLLGELPPPAAAAVDQHLAGCDPCRRDLAAVAVASSALRDASRLQLVETSELPPLHLPVAAPTRGPSRPGRGRGHGRGPDAGHSRRAGDDHARP